MVNRVARNLSYTRIPGDPDTARTRPVRNGERGTRMPKADAAPGAHRHTNSLQGSPIAVLSVFRGLDCRGSNPSVPSQARARARFLKRTHIAQKAASSKDFHTSVGEKQFGCRKAPGPGSAANWAHNRPDPGGAPVWRRRAADGGQARDEPPAQAQRTGIPASRNREVRRRNREVWRGNRGRPGVSCACSGAVAAFSTCRCERPELEEPGFN